MKEQPTSRRHFLSLMAKRKNTLTNSHTTDNKIKMLTADGKLVEVNAEALKHLGQKPKTKNTDILKWMNTGKSEK